MSLRSNTVVRGLLILCVFSLGWYTVKLYAGLYGRLTPPGPDDNVKVMNKEKETKVSKKDEVKSEINDPDGLVDHEKIKQVEKEWDDGKLPDIAVPKYQCEMVTDCSQDKFSFKVVSGAANVIGPSLCFNGIWVMRNVLNNVDRGMNLAIINGKDGKLVKTGIFDLYAKDSTDLKKFLTTVTDEDIILATSYDDAAFRLDKEARDLLAGFGSKMASTLSFRDNWIFVGGKKIDGKEEFIKMDKEKNKYGDWPEAINLEGCLEKLK